MIFQGKSFSYYAPLTGQISMFDCLFFLRYWTICVSQLFVSQVVLSWFLKLTLLRLGVTRKALQLAFFFFFFFSFSSMLLDGLSKIVFRNVSWFVKQEACNQDRTYFIGHTKKCFRKNYSLTCYSRRVWHMVYNVRYKK